MGVRVVGENAEESPYVAMTLKLIVVGFPIRGGNFKSNRMLQAEATSRRDGIARLLD